jgi:hypothetical protein
MQPTVGFHINRRNRPVGLLKQPAPGFLAKPGCLNVDFFCITVSNILCWKSASIAGKRIRFATNRVTISEPIGWSVNYGSFVC